MLDLLSEEPDLLEKTDSIDLRLPRPNFELVGNPFRPQDDPRVSAQFSVAYTVALALRHGGVQIDDFDADRIRGDQETQKLADSIRVTANDEGYHQVHLRLSDGSTRKRRVKALKGTPERPLNRMEKRRKIDDALRNIEAHSGDPSLADIVQNVPDEGIGALTEWLRSIRTTADR